MLVQGILILVGPSPLIKYKLAGDTSVIGLYYTPGYVSCKLHGPITFSCALLLLCVELIIGCLLQGQTLNYVVNVER